VRGCFARWCAWMLTCVCATFFTFLRLEKGEFKLRVRAMEVERQNERSKLVQQNTYEGIVALLLIQGAVHLLTIGSGLHGAKPISRALLAGGAFFAARVPLGMLKIRRLDKYNENYGLKA
jgi:hypothetical protein